ncbi:hypothetical protein [Desulfovibrio sp.]|uniref:hypothetical protein n=1 Tax=Desulfovibrio sp. TaxID=885 RepID=UPI0026316D85|nr:hypothetical protein [Desulfovibrio sp.]
MDWFNHAEGIRILGQEKAAKLFDAFGGCRIYVPQKPKAKHKIAEAVGFIGMAALCKEYGQSYIELAQANKPTTKKEHVLALLEQGGKTQCAIAAEAGVSRRYVTMVVAMLREPSSSSKGPKSVSGLTRRYSSSSDF